MRLDRARRVRGARGALVLVLLAGLAHCRRDEDDRRASAASSDARGESPFVDASANREVEGGNVSMPSVRTVSAYAGSATCAACHPDETKHWQGSQHQRAIAYATPEAVAAPFAGESIREGVGSAVFSGRETGRFSVDRDSPASGTQGAEAKSPQREADLLVHAAFGVEPLQQYLVDAADGRIQVLPWAWDTRPKAEGGQRWLHLYPETAGDETHPLHFSRPAQNWNHACADCHMTGFRKRFERARARFESRWQELGVGCEACHGPGREHVAWAAERASAGALEGAARRAEDHAHRLARLDERRDVRWTIDGETGNAVRSRLRETSREIEVCAPCHARRSAITEDWVAGAPFLDHYRPSLLEDGLYYADGQQRDEVYGWGSFLQSRMYAKGVTCGDCHEPHSGELRAQGDALCASCHASTKYATPAHHRHRAGSSGSACVACHMPTTTYMQIDPRHDHSLRVPRPDQSRALGVPNACNGCHVERDVAWAEAAVRKWLGREARGFQRHAEAFAAASAGALDAGSRLRAVAGDAEQPAIVRASALARLDAASGEASAEQLVRAAADPDPLIRLGALEGLATAAPDRAVAAASARLRDPLRAVRFEAVRLVAPHARGLAPAAAADFERAAAELRASLERDADRPEAQAALGIFLAERGDAAGARRALREALRIEPTFEAGYVNLADLERALGSGDESMQILESGLAVLPASAALHHARGLARVRLGRSVEALADLAKAVELDPRSARFAYVLAVALHGQGDVEGAVARLEAAALAHPADRAIREALVGYLEAAGEVGRAAPHRAALERLADAER